MSEQQVVEPPGRAVLERCPDCVNGIAGGERCTSCEGTGIQVMRACPVCGDVAFDYVNGCDQDAGMVCRLGCGHRWTADDPAWQAQRVPASL